MGAIGVGIGRFDREERWTNLADVGEEADDLIALLEQPFEDGGGVETTGVGEADLSLGRHDDCGGW